MNVDVVCPFKGVGNHVDGEELRFMLRSLSNLPVRDVWIAGGELPSWVRNVQHIEVPQDRKDKFFAQTRNLVAILAEPHLSDQVILMNDDFYVVHPMPTLPVYRNTDLVPGRNSARVIKYLKERGVEKPVSYEGHFPLLARRHDLLVVLRDIPDRLHRWKRTIYGNLAGIGGMPYMDVKVHGKLPRSWRDRLFISSSERSFPLMRDALTELFPEPSRYEADAPLS